MTAIGIRVRDRLPIVAFEMFEIEDGAGDAPSFSFPPTLGRNHPIEQS
jgi:hypothetical protein